MKTTFNPGDKIKLTGKFLKNTGQQRGSEGLSKWTVVACDCSLCATGRFVYTDEPIPHDADQKPNRHFNVANVYKVGTVTVRNCP